MRVLLFTDSDAFAGTERHMLDLASGLEKEGAEVQIACPMPSKLHARAQERGIGVVQIEKGGTVDLAAVRTLRYLLAGGAVDVIHSHNGRTAFSASIAVRLAGRGACVTTQHFIEPNRVSRRGVSAIVSHLAHSWVSRETRCFVAISEAARAGMLERGDAPQDKISVVHNGIADPRREKLHSPDQIRRELGVEAGSTLIVCAARLEVEKNVEALISAMDYARSVHPLAYCVIAGEGTRESALREQIRAMGLERNVRILGFRADAIELINACDVFVLPSIAEPFGLVILEAMALGKPVVATDAGGPREIVVHNQTGLLVSARAPRELGEAICRMISRPEERKRFGCEGRRRFEKRFTAAQMAEAMLAVYRVALLRSRNFAKWESGRIACDVGIVQTR